MMIRLMNESTKLIQVESFAPSLAFAIIKLYDITMLLSRPSYCSHRQVLIIAYHLKQFSDVLVMPDRAHSQIALNVIPVIYRQIIAFLNHVKHKDKNKD